VARNHQHMEGRREATKRIVTWLHERANAMNDPKAKAILDVAASDLGHATKDGNLPQVAGH
jgi:hypothetical protein